MSTATPGGNNLLPEIIEAILRLLPPKPLGRFKSVSKTWNSLISDPQFIKTHLHHPHKFTTKLILVSDARSLYSLDISLLFQSLNTDDLSVTGKELGFRSPLVRWEEMLGSCNGLVLAKDQNNTIFFINPTTRDLCKIPLSPFALPERESFVMYGFGYDSSTNDYKVISISFWDTDNEHNPHCTDMFISVYSLRNDSWRKLPNSPYDHAAGYLVSGVLVNQKLHWLTGTRPVYSPTIVAFSLANEDFNEIKLPDTIDNNKAVFKEMVVVGGKLGIFVGIGWDGYELWLMKEYGVAESWTRLCIHGVEIDPINPLCVVEGSDRDMVLGDEDAVFVYNIDERRCRDVTITGGPIGFTIGGTYVESLESPKRIRIPTV